mmetsp:Transcript_18954/g.61949  ORF Transcript_18954/g.61949 Transcript_18954/m.61949 type:complete len:205 (-) Transcript_18954:380-994(-)
MVKPAVCCRSSPDSLLKLPVATKYASALPGSAASPARRRAAVSIFSSDTEGGDGLPSSRRTAAPTAFTQPPSCSRTIMDHKWPGRRTSWFTRLSGLSWATLPAASAYSLWSMSSSSSHLAAPRPVSVGCSRWINTCRLRSTRPASASDSHGGRRSTGRNCLPRKARHSWRVRRGWPKSSRFSRRASSTRSATKESEPASATARE